MAEQTNQAEWHAVYTEEHDGEPAALFRNPADAMAFRRAVAGRTAVIVATDSLKANRDVRDLFASRRGTDTGAATGAEAAEDVRPADLRSRAQDQVEEEQAVAEARSEAKKADRK
jgi:hypothetical protein